MPQLVKKRRSGWAVLAAGAMVASLLAVVASPAVALDEDSKPDAEAKTSACVGDATGDMMFSDVSEGHFFRGAINCLAYYGITIGDGDGNFKPNENVTNEEMVLFMERAAGVAGADAEEVVGDFAETGSDPVHRGDMALLVARLLVEATDDESAVNVTTNDDGTFAVEGVAGDDWDFFADSRRLQNRVHDSAASALYELKVAEGTGMGDFSPASTVSRGAMAAFITRALAHTSARPEGVTIQSDGPGEVVVSVRDANFHPAAKAVVDVFSVSDDRIDEAFNEDGTCNKPRLRGEGGDTTPCVIGALDAFTGLSGDYDPGVIDGVQPGGRTVFAWTGDRGDEVEDGPDGLAQISLTETAPVVARGSKVTTDLGEDVDRAAFGTVTVTIQMVGAAPDYADAGAPADGATFNVLIRSDTMMNQASDDLATALTPVSAGDTVTTQTVMVGPDGKVTFPVTVADPDPNDADDVDGASVDYVTVTYTVTHTRYGAVDDISDTASGAQTIRFSDAPSVFRRASVTPAAKYLSAPSSGSASNVVAVKVVDQYGKPVSGHQVVLTSDATSSRFPIPRQTDSSGTVRIGYSYSGTGQVETLTANTPGDTNTAIPGGTATFYWVAAPTEVGDVTAGVLRVAEVDSNTVIVGGDGSTAPQLLVYDDNDQFVIGLDNATMAAFEEQLAKEDGDDPDDNTVGATGYNPNDPSAVARFTYTVVGNS